MDIFIEQLIARKKDGVDRAKTVLIFASAALLTIVAVFLSFILSSISVKIAYFYKLLMPFLVVFLWYGAIIMYSKLNIEFEYTVINGNLDVDKIMSKKSRKRVLSIDIKDVGLMANINDEENNYLYNNPPQDVKLLDFTARDSDTDVYFIDCNVNSSRTIVLFQPNETIVESLWKFNPKAVKKYNL